MTDRHWVITTRPQAELRTAAALRILGLDAFTPVEMRLKRVSRHSKRRLATPYPLFNRYVIVANASFPWREVEMLRREDEATMLALRLIDRRLGERGTRDWITGYIGHAGVPAAVPSREAQRLRNLGDNVCTTVRVNGGIKAGDYALITDGPFAGRSARIERIGKTGRNRGRGIAMVEWLGQVHEIAVPIEHLVAA